MSKAANEENKNNPYKAWIGLRADGDETEVTWAWANGRQLGSETFTESQILNFNEMAARKNKKCLIARVEYESVSNASSKSDAFIDFCYETGISGLLGRRIMRCQTLPLVHSESTWQCLWRLAFSRQEKQ